MARFAAKTNYLPDGKNEIIHSSRQDHDACPALLFNDRKCSGAKKNVS